MNRFIILLVVMTFLVSCADEASETPIVARVGERYFTEQQLKDAIPNNLSAEDSAEMANTIIQSWMNRELLFDKSQYNLLEEQQTIEEQVSQYRQELYIFAYEKELLNQKLDTMVSEQAIEQFYQENPDIFQLNDYILKVRYIKVKPNSPDLEKVEKWMQRSADAEAQEKLQDYCHKYAVKCFYDSNWVYLNDLLRELPIEVYNKESFLRSGKQVRFSDNEHLYILTILDLQSKNTLSPLNLERTRIRNLILNKRKIELLNTIRKRIYRDAISSGKAELYAKPQLPQ